MGSIVVSNDKTRRNDRFTNLALVILAAIIDDSKWLLKEVVLSNCRNDAIFYFKRHLAACSAIGVVLIFFSKSQSDNVLARRARHRHGTAAVGMKF